MQTHKSALNVLMSWVENRLIQVTSSCSFTAADWCASCCLIPHSHFESIWYECKTFSDGRLVITHHQREIPNLHLIEVKPSRTSLATVAEARGSTVSQTLPGKCSVHTDMSVEVVPDLISHKLSFPPCTPLSSPAHWKRKGCNVFLEVRGVVR